MALSQQLRDIKLGDGDFVMVASIDFGTTFSGYAFSFKSSKNEIRMNKNWGEEAGHQSFKTPTSVLLDSRGRMLAFGFEAETKYNDLVVSQGEDSCELYRHFKMALHNQKHLSRKSQVQSVRGTPAEAQKIFTYSVQYLKNHLLEAVAKSVHSPPNPDLIRWVITVPAIWSEESKNFMREVAYKAGLMKSENSRQFMICLEPEAASIYCRQLETDQFARGAARGQQLLQKAGTKYMIVDAGGGTIDIAVHEIMTDGTVKELEAASGGDWGGTKVDENFIKLLIKVLGEDFILRYQRESPSEWLELRVNFERRKRAARPDDKSSIISIPLSWGIGSKYQEVTGKNIEKVLRSTPVQGVRFNNGNIILEADVVQSLFEPVTSRIVGHIQRIARSTPVSLILLNGGFGESAFLQQAIIDTFSPLSIAVLCPSEASIAIIKGAVLFGHRPSVIQSRIARKTYGTDVNMKYDPEKHPANRKTNTERGERCKVFQTFVKKGDVVKTNEVRVFRHLPTRADQQKMTKFLYSSDKEEVTYPDEPGVKRVGQIAVHIPDTTAGLKRRVELSVFFGATEIRVEGKELKDGGNASKAEATIDFLAD